jgi:hypothetical protein
MKFSALNIDELYEKITDLNEMFSEQEKDLNNTFPKIINEMKQHWKGKDASNNINDFIKLHENYNAFAESAYKTIYDVSVPVSKVMLIKNYNIDISDKIIKKKYISYNKEDFSNSNDELYIEMESLKKDYNELDKELSLCTDNYKRIVNCIEEIEKNWISGTDRDKLCEKLDIFEKEYSSFINEYSDFLSNIKTSISNINSIGGEIYE